MDAQELARIRKAQEGAAEAVLGTPKDNIPWMGYSESW
jgi:hypothetical protein